MIKPTGLKALLKPIYEERDLGGIIVANDTKETNLYEVVDIGMEGMDCNIGDKVLVDKYAGTPIMKDKIEYKIVNENEILAIVE